MRPSSIKSACRQFALCSSAVRLSSLTFKLMRHSGVTVWQKGHDFTRDCYQVARSPLPFDPKEQGMGMHTGPVDWDWSVKKGLRS